MLRSLFSRARISAPAVAFLFALGFVLLVVMAIGVTLIGEGDEPVPGASKTVLGQAVVYPTGSPAKVTSLIVTMQPGEETGWHKHDVPLFGYMLEGEITVDYEGAGTRVYRKGDSVLEAIGTPHNGRNTGAGPARILAVFMGAVGVPDTEKVEAPQ